MRSSTDNVLPFPKRRRRAASVCPQCGTHTDLWRLGRLLWGFCHDHELRWVVADLRETVPGPFDLTQFRRRLEFLSSFEEISY